MKFLTFGIIPAMCLQDLTVSFLVSLYQVRYDGTQHLQMETGSLCFMVVYGKIVDDHVIVNGSSPYILLTDIFDITSVPKVITGFHEAKFQNCNSLH